MASTIAVASVPSQPPGPNLSGTPSGSDTSRAGRRGSRGTYGNQHEQRSGRGRGRGGQRGASRTPGQGIQKSQRQSQSHPPAQPSPFSSSNDDPDGRHVSITQPNGYEPHTDAIAPSGEKEQQEGVEAEVCFICASPVIHNSVAPCNHRTCHICALRLRALYKTRACAHCRVSSSQYR